MARTPLTINEVTSASKTINGNEEIGTTDGKSIDNQNQNVVVYVRNDNAAEKDLTIPTPATVGKGAQTIEDEVYVMPAAGFILVGPFENRLFGQADGSVWLNFEADAVADFKCYAFKIPRVAG